MGKDTTHATTGLHSLAICHDAHDTPRPGDLCQLFVPPEQHAPADVAPTGHTHPLVDVFHQRVVFVLGERSQHGGDVCRFGAVEDGDDDLECEVLGVLDVGSIRRGIQHDVERPGDIAPTMTLFSALRTASCFCLVSLKTCAGSRGSGS